MSNSLKRLRRKVSASFWTESSAIREQTVYTLTVTETTAAAKREHGRVRIHLTEAGISSMTRSRADINHGGESKIFLR